MRCIAVYYAHLETEPPLCSKCNSAVPPTFDEVVTRALAKDPEDRFSSASAFGDACHEALVREGAAQIAVTAEPKPGLPAVMDGSAQVLVWNRDSGDPRIHRDETCTTLARVVAPPSAIAFAGPGTSGWMTLYEAIKVPNAAICFECTWDPVELKSS